MLSEAVRVRCSRGGGASISTMRGRLLRFPRAASMPGRRQRPGGTDRPSARLLPRYPVPAWDPIRDHVLRARAWIRRRRCSNVCSWASPRKRLDAAGRVVAPRLRRKFAALEAGWLVGQGAHFELWSDEALGEPAGDAGTGQYRPAAPGSRASRCRNSPMPTSASSSPKRSTRLRSGPTASTSTEPSGAAATVARCSNASDRRAVDRLRP